MEDRAHRETPEERAKRKAGKKDELRSSILGYVDHFETLARTKLENFHDEKTVCFMWQAHDLPRNVHNPKFALSGPKGAPSDPRHPICAELNFLHEHGDAEWLFSVAASKDIGWKRACGNKPEGLRKCAKKLHGRNIIDLADEFRQQSSWRGKRSKRKDENRAPEGTSRAQYRAEDDPEVNGPKRPQYPPDS